MIRIARSRVRALPRTALVLAALLAAAPVGLSGSPTGLSIDLSTSAWAASPPTHPSASPAIAPPVLSPAPAPGPEAAHPNVRVVREFYRQYAAGNMEAVRAFFAPNVEWSVTGDSSMAGTKRSVQDILWYLWQMKRSGVSVDARLVGAVGEYVLDARPVVVQRGGVPQSIVWVRVYELREGRIAKVREFPSDQEAADVFFWQAFPPKPEERPIIDFVPRPGQ